MSKNWSTDKKNWGSLPKEFLEGNWKRTKVTSSDKSLVSEKSGIYMYCISVPRAKNKSIKTLNTPVYMGIAKNLRKRFIDHLDDDDSLYPHRKCFGSYMDFYYLIITPYNKQEIRLFFEQTMFDCFGKVVNKIDSVAKTNPIRGSIKKWESI